MRSFRGSEVATLAADLGVSLIEAPIPWVVWTRDAVAHPQSAYADDVLDALAGVVALRSSPIPAW
jgi:hypothetical protein